MEELGHLARSGQEAHAIFLIQRPDAVKFMPNWVKDKAFSASLLKAGEEGVGLHAWSVRLNRKAATLEAQIPVETHPSQRA